MTEVAVVILNFNGKHFLQQFLGPVISYSGKAQIVVADNGSTDGSAQFIEAVYPDVKLIRIPVNKGFCGGYNVALKQVEATYYVLLNSDVEVTPDWIEPIVATMNADASIAAVQPKILSFHNKSKFEYAGAGGGMMDQLGYPFCRGRLFDSIEKDQHQYDDVVPIFWATGACLFIRSACYHHLGGLDEDFFAHMEEIDLCWKLNREGYNIYYQGKSTVYHVGGGTLSSSSPRKTYLNFRNGLSLLFKHSTPGALLWKMPLRVGLDWLASLRFLMIGYPKDSGAVLSAHLSFINNLPIEWKKRILLKRQISNFKVNQTYKGYIVFDYFLFRKKTYKDLGV